ncbi:MAG: Smr/MutS family protein [Candidatus Eisenbacteria bacterium]|nr:Smr/MutS family protein [Candidatus Eisenbacteria bacterium]
MNAHSLSVLEFDKVRAMVVRSTFSPRGRKRAEALAPNLSLEEIRLSHARTLEWRTLELSGDAPGPSPIGDLEPLLVRLRRGTAALDGVELYAFLPVLQVASDLRRIFARLAETGRSLPNLTEVGRSIGEFSALRARLARSVSPSGEVLDSASPLLARARRELIDTQKRASDLLDGMLDRLSHDREDAFVTLRDGRYVLSVRSQHRSVYGGIVHGRSQTGQSVLVEPLEALEANNAVADRREEVVREELRVLDELTDALRGAVEPLESTIEAVGWFDLIRAQARLALDIGGEAPELNAEGRLHIVAGRHPLLAEAERRGGARVVPLDIEFSRERPVVILSGPNMGGKTVALKTVGLSTAMARAGLLVPAGPGTDLPLVDDLFVDLGDEQSIEGELSTFAGHLKNIGETWEEATGESLVLLDELGSGTDPEEGAPLAMALLNGLAERRTLTLATTHLAALKGFASEHERMQNASMEFDAVSLRPRYRFRMGEAGRSRALDIARRMFPSSTLLTEVERFRSPLAVQLDKIYAEVETEKRALVQAREELEAEEARLAAATERRERQTTRLRERIDGLRRDRESQVRALFHETQASLEAMRKTLEEQVRALQPEQALEQVRRAERALTRQRSESDLPGRPRSRGARLTAEAVQVGAKAWLSDLNDTVRIQRVSEDGKKAWVEWQGRRLEVEIRRLEQTPRDYAPRPPRVTFRADEAPNQEVPRELDLRGLSAEEATARVDRHLDLAARRGVVIVRIVHGKGTGTLKREVERLLGRHPLVVSYRQGEPAEGGWGVTVAELGGTAR